MSLVDAAIVRLLPAVPRPVVRRISERYIAGEELDDALRVVRELNDQGKLATIDVLGEEIAEPDEARAIAAAYREAFEAIERGRLDSNVSVKPTALGLKLGYDLFRENLLDVVRHAAERGNFVRIDMEDSSTTDDTLRAYRELRDSGFENVGIVLQARLKRTLADLARAGGAAAERAALQGHLPRAGRDRLPRLRLGPRRASCRRSSSCSSWAATSGSRPTTSGSSSRASDWSRSEGSGGRSTSSRCCSACGRRSATSSSASGHRLRIYTPFGRHWYAYSLRRLQENPKIAGYIAADTVGRILPGRNGSV